MTIKTISSVITLCFFISCSSTSQEPNETAPEPVITPKTDSISVTPTVQKEFPPVKVEDRTSILASLTHKVENGLPLVVHVKVPLCDNEHQGIVPTTPSLGNGMDLKRNLYWATSKGMKRYFKELPDWKLIRSTLDPNKDVLERVIFKKKYSNGTIVYMVADAYRGDRMVPCLNDHFNSLTGKKKDTLIVDQDTLGIYGNADLLAFNGHDGLMDESTTYSSSTDGKQRDAVSISCVSNQYFNWEYEKTNAYPLVLTTGLLYPGAFVMEGIINEWAMLKSGLECKKGAGRAYYKHKPKSGPNGSQNLFDTGW